MSIAHDVWEDLAAAGRIRQFRRGDRLIREGDPSGSVILIRRGAVRVSINTSAGDEVTLAVRGPGEIIGHHSVLGGDATRSAAVVAIAAGEGAWLTPRQFLDAMQAHPDFLQEQVRLLLDQLRAADERFVELLTLSVAQRVVRQLGRLSVVLGAGPDGLDLSQEEFASMCGATRGAVAAVLADLRARRVVETSRRRISVTDPAALAEVSAELDRSGR